MRPRLLVVDDEARQMEALCRTLTPEGYDVTGFSVPEEALAALREQPFDVLLTDLMMPGMDGLTLLAAALELDPDLVGIMMSGQGTVTSAVDAMKIGALDYILKPFNLTAIRPVLARAVDVRRLRLDNIRLRETVSLYEVSNTIARSLDSETVLARVADAVLEQSRAHEVGVYVARAGASDLRLVAARGRDVASLPEFLPRESATSSARVSAAPGPAIWQQQIAMVVDGRLVGSMLCRVSTPQRPMSPGELKGLGLIAATAATALEASMLLEHLRRSNDDLRTFAWAASHDLQEPLRDVALHTQLLERRQHALDGESSTLARAAADGARRMLRLVQELRTFVEAGQAATGGGTVADGNAALDRALSDLRGAITDTHAGIDRGQMPVLRIGEGDLAEVFRRLLDNAIKFRRPGSAPRIEIGARAEDGHWVLSIGDAGIGIDPDDHTRIFELFQRVNRREDYDGVGMGLPVCRRLVEAYGGRVWVESRAGEGARFFVAIPAATASAPS